MNMNKNTNNKIEGYEQYYLYELFTGESFGDIKDLLINKPIGRVINVDTGEILSEEITPMVMMINQNIFIDEFRDFMNGRNDEYTTEFDKEINYYGRKTSAREIAVKYRKY
jgi:hypothetical protein